MKKVLVLQHMDHDHPGRFANFFAEDGLIPYPVRVFEGEAVPSLAGFDMMFALGGAQDTWEEDKYPYLAEEKAAIREWVWECGKPYFGVCLGHQLLATALGGEVAKADVGEVGVFEVAATEDGAAAGLPEQMRVMQWHYAEVKRAPQSAKVLASSDTTAVQMIEIGDHAMSTQFHCEFTPQTVAGWRSLPGYVAALEKNNGAGAYERLMQECYPLMPKMEQDTRKIWERFKRRSGLVR